MQLQGARFVLAPIAYLHLFILWIKTENIRIVLRCGNTTDNIEAEKRGIGKKNFLTKNSTKSLVIKSTKLVGGPNMGMKFGM